MRFFQTSHITMEIDEKIPWTIDGDYRGDLGSVDIVIEKCAVEMFRDDGTRPRKPHAVLGGLSMLISERLFSK